MKNLIDQLFSWKKELNVINNKGEAVLTVYQRLVGDSDLQSARIKALSFSREFRKILRNRSTDEYIALVEGYDDFNREELINTILFDQIIDMRTEVERGFYFAEPVEPDEDASTESLENYQAEKDSWETRRNDKLNKLMEKELAKRKKEIEKEDDVTLLETAKKSRIDSLCEIELRRKFLDLCTYFGTYSDKRYKVRLFKDYEEFSSSADFLKSQLIDGYTSLEMSSVNLKGSQGPVS